MCSERSVCTNNIVTSCPNPVITNLLLQVVLHKAEHKLPYMVLIWVPSLQVSFLLPLAIGHVPLTQICMYLVGG